jgi:membrane-anchored protein YejM (alkaline phosphatase superfamily)
MESPSRSRLTDKQTKTVQPFCADAKHRRLLKLLLPRIETFILFAGLACTVWGKLVILRPQKPPSLFYELALVAFPDVLFFAAVGLVISCLYLLKPSAFTARCTLLISVLVSTWSVLNTGWLVRSGAQLQPGVLKIMIRDFKELWPFVQPQIAKSLGRIIILAIVVLAGCVYILRCLIRPQKVVLARIHHARWTAAKMLAVIVLLVAQPMFQTNSNPSFTKEILGFSNHWYALVSFVPSLTEGQHTEVRTRNIARIGEREVIVPKYPSNNLPNIVLVLLESISYSVTPLSNPKLDTMPNLAGLAKESVEFTLTRVPVSHTTQAFWTTLTSTTPAIQAGYAEAIPVEEPYEGLASLLARAGYRSAFFEMSRGSFECAAGFFNNLGFDWAWFRENLEDPSAHIGLVAGDDCSMLKPAFEWASQGSEPFLLMMITTVSHEPFDVPAWFDKPKEKPYEKYIQAIQFTDYFLGRLREELKGRGLEKNTILCVLGDHGTGFRSQTNKARWCPYEEIIRVPWVIHWPGHVKAGEKIDWPCSQMDVTPTILKLIGFDITNAGFEGRDAFTPSAPDRRFYFSSWFTNSPLGFVEGSRKVVYWPYLDKIFEYDLDADPMEENPKIVSPSEMEQIKREVLSWQDKSQIKINPKRYTEQFLYSHWQTFSTGSFAGAYYVP